MKLALGGLHGKHVTQGGIFGADSAFVRRKPCKALIRVRLGSKPGFRSNKPATSSLILNSVEKFRFCHTAHRHHCYKDKLVRAVEGSKGGKD